MVFFAVRTPYPRFWAQTTWSYCSVGIYCFVCSGTRHCVLAQATGLIGVVFCEGHTLYTNFGLTAPELQVLSANRSLPFIVIVSLVVGFLISWIAVVAIDLFLSARFLSVRVIAGVRGIRFLDRVVSGRFLNVCIITVVVLGFLVSVVY